MKIRCLDTSLVDLSFDLSFMGEDVKASVVGGYKYSVLG